MQPCGREGIIRSLVRVYLLFRSHAYSTWRKFHTSCGMAGMRTKETIKCTRRKGSTVSDVSRPSESFLKAVAYETSEETRACHNGVTPHA